MPKKRKSSSNGDGDEEKQIYCRRCHLVDSEAKRKPKSLWKYKIDDRYGNIVCDKMCEHLAENPRCKRYYHSLWEREDRFDDFSCSIWVSKPRKKGMVLATNVFGLTNTTVLTESLPKGARNLNPRLDEQVMYDNRYVQANPELVQQVIEDPIFDFDQDEEYYDDNCDEVEYYDDDCDDDGIDISSKEDDDNVVLLPPTTEHQVNAETNNNNEGEVQVINFNNNRNEPNNYLRSRIKLLKLLKSKGIPLRYVEDICNWAWQSHQLDGSGWNFSRPILVKPYKTVIKEISEVNPELSRIEGFKQAVIRWYEEDSNDASGVQPVFVRSFREALRSLLSNEEFVKDSLAFPDEESPFVWPKGFAGSTRVSELYHGSWWRETWMKECEKDSNEILVPIILYMDGVSIDKHGRLSLCPLQMTLGIFSTIARRKPEAWETLYFHPASKNKNPLSNLKNLHLGLAKALESVKEACAGVTLWKNMPWNGKKLDVKMKFSIAFFIGDTEIHDKLCGHYSSRNNVQMLCRHCNCPYDKTNIPSENVRVRSKNREEKRKKWKPSDFNKNDKQESYFQSISHHRINNVFHDLDFGVNDHNIHFATPGEKLHMHQLGIAKRYLETFQKEYVTGSKLSDLSKIAERYGGQLHRQSDRDFPKKMNFPKDQLGTTMKEGKHYAGMLLTLLLSMLSDDGQKILLNERDRNKKDAAKKFIEGQIKVIELLLGFEVFLGSLETKMDEIKNLDLMVGHLVNTMNEECSRERGTGNILVKTHLLFHLKDYISLWGPADGFDSSYAEGHHRSELKIPANLTQKNNGSLIEQTGTRLLECRLIDKLDELYDMDDLFRDPNSSEQSEGWDNKNAGGSHFTMTIDKSGEVVTKWKRKELGEFPKDVLELCKSVIEHALPGNTVEGYTTHRRFNQVNVLNFRASPNFRGKVGQRSNIWYDWAEFNEEYNGMGTTRVGQLLCFLYLETVVNSDKASGLFVEGPGHYAVVRPFEKMVKHEHSNFVQIGKGRDKLRLYDCETIASPAAVVQNVGAKNKYFYVGNREFWLDDFKKKMKGLKVKEVLP